MSENLSLKKIQRAWHGSLKAYVVGFVASLSLTLISFFLIETRLFSSNGLIYSLSGLALGQAIVQLLFFLHVGKEAKPRWETLVFLFMVMVLLIIVLGSLWIMQDLEHRVMGGMGHD